MKTTRIAIHGAAGRMGRAVIQTTLATPGARLVAAIDRKDNPELGGDVGAAAGMAPIGVTVGYVIDPAAEPFEVMIDFTQPEATLAALDLCRCNKKAMVIGTTGFTAGQREAIEMASKEIPICTAANFSIGVNVVLGLLGQAARTLGDEYDVEIVEAHHRHKADAPSGTALALGRAVAEGRAVSLDDVRSDGRSGVSGERAVGEIAFHALRGGEIVGEHEVRFIGASERVSLGHVATDRALFAAGALRAAQWIAGRAPGSYTMRDVLGLTD